LVLNIEFAKARDMVDWVFVLNMVIWLGFGAKFIAMVHALFIEIFSLVSIDVVFSNLIYLHKSIRKR
jgi:hypothetical protein